jgi:hypothetical protein
MYSLLGITIFVSYLYFLQAATAFITGKTAHVELSIPIATSLGWQFVAVIGILVWYIHRRESSVYLLDFATFQPPESWRFVTTDGGSLMIISDSYQYSWVCFTECLLSKFWA